LQAALEIKSLHEKVDGLTAAIEELLSSSAAAAKEPEMLRR